MELKLNDHTEAISITEKARALGLGDVSMHVWKASCMKHGVGGTPKAVKMYENIMKVLVAEFKAEENNLFDDFWKAYPNKKAKPVALKKWKTLKVDDELFAKIMTALEAHKKTPQWTKDDGQYIPHPSTWLNQRRWEDELKVEKTSENQSKFGHL